MNQPRKQPLGRVYQPPAHPRPAVLHPHSARPARALLWQCQFLLSSATSPNNSTHGGQEAQETGNGPSGHLCRFLGKKKFFFKDRKDCFQPLVQICPFSPYPSHLWGFFLKQGKDTPGSSEHRMVKSQNVSWVFPLELSGQPPSFYN